MSTHVPEFQSFCSFLHNFARHVSDKTDDMGLKRYLSGILISQSVILNWINLLFTSASYPLCCWWLIWSRQNDAKKKPKK